uniref:Uncharacterized protein n=1 Tax=Panagrolaimus sp. ES5 TaxID=591445 RepID=A0AC34GJF1_9BILA
MLSAASIDENQNLSEKPFCEVDEAVKLLQQCKE